MRSTWLSYSPRKGLAGFEPATSPFKVEEIPAYATGWSLIVASENRNPEGSRRQGSVPRAATQLFAVPKNSLPSHRKQMWIAPSADRRPENKANERLSAGVTLIGDTWCQVN